ncbi:MAG: phosphotransferase [Nanoarchaeota archaeon]
MLNNNEYKELLNYYNINFNKILPDIKLNGSPERCLFRICIKDINNKKYILEKIPSQKIKRKQEIIDLIINLNKYNIKETPNFLKSKNNEYIINFNNSFFQLQEFIEGETLIQPDYLNDSIKGENLAKLLIKINKKNIKVKNNFSIKKYIYSIIKTIKLYDYNYYLELFKIIKYLESNLFINYDKIPESFSHGDLHPLNVIWDNEKIKSLIDFEFFSKNLEMYDAANLLGCLGIENPYQLTKEGFSESFIKTIKKENIYSQISYKNFIDLIIAIRFGWISEWFRKNDIEMKKLELDYIKFLIKNKQKIEKYYNL